jgi:hypothetical protein
MRTALYFSFIVLFVVSCSRQELPPGINLEQTHNSKAQHILAPGMGTIGIITEDSIHIYYPDEDGGWLPDESSRFGIPENSRGILAMGMGTIAVAADKRLNFYRLNSFDQWQQEEYMSFSLPDKYDRLIAMKMPWEIGVIGIENDGIVDFHYFYDKTWQYDSTASFVVPNGISSYYPAGDMTIAVVDGHKLGIYYLTPDKGWEFMDYDPYVLLLPDGFEGIIPYDKRTIAVLRNSRLYFYSLDLENDRWVILNDLQFNLPF